MQPKEEVRFTPLLYTLVVIYGISSWIGIHGIWMEMPLLVLHQPEGWHLPAYSSFLMHVGNVGPMTISLTNIVLTRFLKRSRLPEVILSYTIIGLGALALLLLAFFWQTSSFYWNNEHSAAYFVLLFFVAMAANSSSVVYIPFMYYFHESYVSALFVGEGIGALLASVLGLIQGVGSFDCLIDNGTILPIEVTTAFPYNVNANYSIQNYEAPRFSTRLYFILLCILTLVSGAAFIVLNTMLKSAEDKKVKSHVQQQTTLKDETTFSTDHVTQKVDKAPNDNCYGSTSSGNSGHAAKTDSVDLDNSLKESTKLLPEDDKKTSESPPKSETVFLICTTTWVTALTGGVMYSLQVFATAPYGFMFYHLSVSMGFISMPIACFVNFCVPARSRCALSVLLAIGTCLASYIIAVAAMSPNPPLKGNLLGGTLVLSAWTLSIGILTYIQVEAASQLKMKGQRPLILCGTLTQVGSTLGSTIMLILIQKFKIFTSINICRI